MRPLFVVRAAAGLSLAAAAAILTGSAPSALHPGDDVTDRQLYSFLSFPPHPGDWVKYRVAFAGRSTAVKTIGFGSETVDGRATLYVETYVHAVAVTGLPAGSSVGIGTDASLKTYVTGSSFGDLAYPYRVVTTAVKIGTFEYELSPGADESYTALAGTSYSAPRSGTVRSVEAVDMHVGEQALHATHVVATFTEAPLPVGGVALPFTLELWQSPDAPLGTIAISSVGPREVRWRMLAYGRGDYRSTFKQTLDQIRAQSAPSMR